MRLFLFPHAPNRPRKERLIFFAATAITSRKKSGRQIEPLSPRLSAAISLAKLMELMLHQVGVAKR
jgi:hypothetical protein